MYEEPGSELSFFSSSDDHDRKLELFQRLIDEANDAFYLVDPDTGHVLDINKTACEMLGYERDSLRGMGVWDFSRAVDSQAEYKNQFGPEGPEDTTIETEHERADGTTIPVEVSYSTLDVDGQTYRVAICREITERKSQRKDLEAAKKRYRTLLQTAPDPIFVADLDTGRIIEANERAATLLGRTCDELVGITQSDLHPSGDREQYVELFERHAETDSRVRKLPDGSQVRLVTDDGAEIPVEINATPVQLPESRVVFGIFRVLEEQLTYEERLTAINEVGYDLTDCETVPEVSRLVVETVTDLLDFEWAVVYRYDDRQGILRPAVSDPDHRLGEDASDLPVFEASEGVVWQAFLDGRTARLGDIDPEERLFSPATQLKSGLLVPIGGHGVVIVGDTRQDAFDGRDVTLIETLAGLVEAAFDRIEHEGELDERARQLDRRRDSLESLQEMVEVGRELTRVVVRDESSEDIAEVVCRELADTDAVSFAWIGECDVDNEVLEPRAKAGDQEGYLQTLDLGLDADAGREPAQESVRTGQPVTVQNTGSNLFEEPWREEAVRRGFQSVMSVPVTYQTGTYEVLTVYAEESGRFEESVQSVLGALGDLLAHADVAAKRTRALVADTETELEFEIQDPKCFLLRFAEQCGCSFELDSVEPGTNGTWTVSATVTDGPQAKCLEHAKEAPEIDRVTLVESDDGPTLELCVCEQFVIADLSSHGLVVRQVTADGSSCRVTVAVPSNLSPKRAGEVVSTLYPESQLVAKRQRPGSAVGTETTGGRCLEQLTNRQQEVLREAYRCGYFESPKGASGTEIADELDMSASAFHDHLRAAERQLVEMTFSTEPSSSGSSSSQTD